MVAEFIEITENISKKLIDEEKRTGFGFTKILRGNREEKIEGLNSHQIRGWAKGITKKAKKAHVDFVLQKYASLPTHQKIPLTHKKAEYFRRIIKSTRISFSNLVRIRDDVPIDFCEKKFRKKLVKPIAKTYYKAHGDYVERICIEYRVKSQKTRKKTKPKLSNSHRPISESDLRFLRSIRDKTGILPGLLFNHSEPPEGLNPSIISSWMRGAIKSARPEYVAWVKLESRKLLESVLSGNT